jgi:hypothetical protein
MNVNNKKPKGQSRDFHRIGCNVEGRNKQSATTSTTFLKERKY